MPIGASAHASAKLVKGAILKVYEGGSHALPDTSRDQLNADLDRMKAQAAQAVELLDQLVSQADGVAAPDAGAQDNRQQLGGRQDVGAPSEQTLSGALGFRG